MIIFLVNMKIHASQWKFRRCGVTFGLWSYFWSLTVNCAYTCIYMYKNKNNIQEFGDTFYDELSQTILNKIFYGKHRKTL